MGFEQTGEQADIARSPHERTTIDDPLHAEAVAAPLETGVLLVAAREEEARAFRDELNERLAPAHVIDVRSIRDALAVGVGGVDCIVLDVDSLENYSGVEAVRYLRSGVSDYIPLLVLVDGTDDSIGRAALQFGAQGYLLKKDMAHGQLARSIASIVRRQQVEMAEHELFVAQAQARESVRLERGLSPQPLLRDAPVWVTSVYKAGRRRALLGGDFVDLVQLDERRVRAVVGDVCGHGPDEAAIGVSLRAAWRALALAEAATPSAARTLETIFKQERHIPGLFVTLCTLDLDLDASVAEVLIAGHPCPALIEGGDVRCLAEDGGRAIGIGDGDWETKRVPLSARDWTILCYTDGLIEGRTGDGSSRLGEEGLHRLIEEQIRLRPSWRDHPRELLNDIVDATEEANGGPLSDDLAILMVGAAER